MNHHHGRLWLRFLLLAPISLGVALCPLRAMAALPFKPAAESDANKEKSDKQSYLAQMALDLELFDQYAGRLMDIGQQQFEARRPSNEQSRNAVALGKNIKDRLAEIRKNPDPLAGLIDRWALAAQYDEYTHSEEAKKPLGPLQPVMADLTAQLVSRISILAASHLPASTEAEVAGKVRGYVAANTIRDRKKNNAWPFDFNQSFFSIYGDGKSMLSKLAAIPLAPVEIGSSMRTGSQGVQDIGAAAERFTNVVDALPARLRIEIQTLLKQLLDNQDKLSALLKEARGVSDGLDHAVGGANELTTGVQRNLAAATTLSLEARRTALSIAEAARQTTELTAAIERLLKTANTSGAPASASQHSRIKTADGKTTGSPTAAPFDINDYAKAAEAIRAGAEESRRLTEAIDRLANGPEPAGKTTGAHPATNEHPFDIREYESAAKAIGQSSEQLRALLEGVDRTLNSDAAVKNAEPLRREAEKLVGVTAESWKGVIDHAAWRAAQLLGLAFALALALVALRRRRPPAATGQSEPNGRSGRGGKTKP